METLKETELIESKGITIHCDPWKETIIEAAGIVNPFACENPRAIPINRSADFNLNGIIDSSPIGYDLNCDGQKIALVAYKIDWDNIKFLQLDGNEEAGLILGNNSEEEQEDLKGKNLLAHRLLILSGIHESLSRYKKNLEEYGLGTPGVIGAINDANRTIGEINTTALINNAIENNRGILFEHCPPTSGKAIVRDNINVSHTIRVDIKGTLTEEGGISLTESIGADINSNISIRTSMGICEMEGVIIM